MDKYELITNAISDGFLLLDENFKIKFHNKKALSLFSIKNIDKFSFLQLFRNERLEDALKSLYIGEIKSVEIKKENYIFYVELSKIKEGYTIFVRNITEEARIRKLQRELGANIGHVLKTPLTSISGFAELINNGMVEESEIKNFTLKIEKEAKRMISLVEDIIKFGELTSISEPEYVNVEEKIYYVLEMFEQNIIEKNIKVSIEGESNIKIQHIHIIEILTNIIDNAIKYNIQNGEIKIFLGEKLIKIKDTGIGIREENIQNIFERFYRMPNSEVKGNGLGLSIVYEIIKLYGGNILCESIPGKGTTFTIEF